MNVADALRDAAARLSPFSDTPRLDAELLLAHALGIAREQLLLDVDRFEVPPAFAALTTRRVAGEPLAYVTGIRDFWTISLAVTTAVLIPRPDSETLIEAAVRHFVAAPPRRILDLGTGSGALLLAALDQWPEASGMGIDASAAALAIAAENARRLGLEARADLRPGDWAKGLDERFDLILCNPPYIKSDAALGPGVREHEPHAALFAGDDGLDAYRAIAPALPRLITPAGMAAVEIGFDQGEAAAVLFRRAGLHVNLAHDLAGHPRCLIVTPA